MSYPTIFYKTPGPFSGNGHTYATIGVKDADQAKELLAQGWFATYPEATAPKAPKPANDDSAPTREEMEAKAAELGVKFDGRTTDAKLMDKISTALAGG